MQEKEVPSQTTRKATESIDVANMNDAEKAALLHELMKHYTAPTEALVASLQKRVKAFSDLLAPTNTAVNVDGEVHMRLVALRILESLSTYSVFLLQHTTDLQRHLAGMAGHVALGVPIKQERTTPALLPYVGSCPLYQQHIPEGVEEIPCCQEENSLAGPLPDSRDYSRQGSS